MIQRSHPETRLHAPQRLAGHDNGLERDYLTGLVRLLCDDVEAARRWHRSVAADAFISQNHRAVFVAIGRAIDVSPQPNLLAVRFVLEHDDTIDCDPADAASVLFDLHKESHDRPCHLWMQTATDQLLHRYHCGQAADLGRALAATAAAGTLPSDAEIEDVIQRARRMQMQARNPDASARDLLSIIDRWKLNKSEKLLTTGFNVIDRAFGGGLPVGLHGIAAKPKAGKSAIAAQLALGAMLHSADASVVWFRGEMTDDLLLSKMLACWSRMRHESLQAITLRDALQRSPETKAVYLDLLNTVGGRFVTVDPPLTISAIEQHICERKPSLAVVDYLQKCEAPGHKDRRVELDHVVSGLSMLSSRYDIPIIVISAVAGGRDESTDIGALTKESNRLDYDAHTFISLWNDGPKEDNPRKILLRINASRSGQASDDELWFHGAHQFFQAAATYAEFDDHAPKVPLP